MIWNSQFPSKESVSHTICSNSTHPWSWRSITVCTAMVFTNHNVTILELPLVTQFMSNLTASTSKSSLINNKITWEFQLEDSFNTKEPIVTSVLVSQMWTLIQQPQIRISSWAACSSTSSNQFLQMRTLKSPRANNQWLNPQKYTLTKMLSICPTLEMKFSQLETIHSSIPLFHFCGQLWLIQRT